MSERGKNPGFFYTSGAAVGRQVLSNRMANEVLGYFEAGLVPPSQVRLMPTSLTHLRPWNVTITESGRSLHLGITAFVREPIGTLAIYGQREPTPPEFLYPEWLEGLAQPARPYDFSYVFSPLSTLAENLGGLVEFLIAPGPESLQAVKDQKAWVKSSMRQQRRDFRCHLP